MEDCLSRLDRLNQLRGIEKPKTSGTGLKGTWKKLKGKKKKQRNLTAPEISAQTMKALSEINSLEPVKEKEDEKQDGGKTKGGVFGKKAVKKQDSKDPSSDQSQSPKGKKKRNSVVKNEAPQVTAPASPAVSEGDALLSQKSEPASYPLSQQENHFKQTPPDKFHSGGSKSAIDIMMEDLSQTSAGKLSLSQSGTFTGPEEQFSTQSSSDTQFGEHLVENRQRPHSSGPISNENHLNSNENDSERNVEEFFRIGSSKLYSEFGDKQHKLNLERVLEFLKSSGEIKPVDLNALMDWDGWMLASKQIV